MRVFSTLLIVIVLGVGVSACGSATSPIATPSLEPTVTAVASVPTIAPPTSTPVETIVEERIQAGKTAVAQKNYEQAVNSLTQAYMLDPTNTEAAEQLANAYLLAGNDVLEQAELDQNRLRIALTLFQEGENVALAKSDLAQELANNKRATQSMYDALPLLDEAQQLADQQADLGERETKITQVINLLDTTEAARADFPQLAAMRYQALMLLAQIKEITGDNAEAFADKVELWEVALVGCTSANRLNLPDIVGSQQCIERLTQKMIPPTATPTPKPRPTAVPATATPRPRPTAIPATPEQSRLRFVKGGTGDTPNCVSMQISGINVAGWYFELQGSNIRGNFDGGGNARACGLGDYQEFYFNIRDGNGNIVRGGSGVPTRGGDFMIAVWR